MLVPIYLVLSRQPTLVGMMASLFYGPRMRVYYEEEHLALEPVVMFLALRMLMSARRARFSGSNLRQRAAYVALREELAPRYSQLKLPGVRSYEALVSRMELPVDVIKRQLSEDLGFNRRSWRIRRPG